MVVKQTVVKRGKMRAFKGWRETGGSVGMEDAAGFIGSRKRSLCLPRVVISISHVGSYT